MIRFPTDNLSAALLFRDQYAPSRAASAFALRKQAETRLALDLRNQFVPPPHAPTPDPESARKCLPTPPPGRAPAAGSVPTPNGTASADAAGDAARTDSAPAAGPPPGRSVHVRAEEKAPPARMPYGQPADTPTGRLLDIMA